MQLVDSVALAHFLCRKTLNSRAGRTHPRRCCIAATSVGDVAYTVDERHWSDLVGSGRSTMHFYNDEMSQFADSKAGEPRLVAET